MRKGHHHPDQHWNCLKGKRDNLDQTNIAGIWRQQWENIWEAWWSTCGLSRAHHYNLKVNRTVPHNNWHIKMAHSHTAADLSLQTPFELPGQQWSSTPWPKSGFSASSWGQASTECRWSSQRGLLTLAFIGKWSLFCFWYSQRPDCSYQTLRCWLPHLSS